MEPFYNAQLNPQRKSQQTTHPKENNIKKGYLTWKSYFFFYPKRLSHMKILFLSQKAISHENPIFLSQKAIPQDYFFFLFFFFFLYYFFFTSLSYPYPYLLVYKERKRNGSRLTTWTKKKFARPFLSPVRRRLLDGRKLLAIK